MAGNGSNLEQPDRNAVGEASAERVQKRTAQRFPDVQGAARFPIQLPVSLKSNSGDSSAEIKNISANGVLFQVNSDMPVGSPGKFHHLASRRCGGSRCRRSTRLPRAGGPQL